MTRTKGGDGEQRGAEPRNDNRPDAGIAAERGEHARIDRLDAIERDCEVRHEHGRIVVVVVDREPRERAVVLLGPLPKHGRLAVAGRRDRRDYGSAGPAQAVDEGGARDGPGAQMPGGELRLEEREGRFAPIAVAPANVPDGRKGRCHRPALLRSARRNGLTLFG